MQQVQDGAGGWDGNNSLPKLSCETRLTPKEQRSPASSGDQVSRSTSTKSDWGIAALSLAYTPIQANLAAGALRAAFAQPSLGWAFAVVFHVAFGFCCTLLVFWGVNKGPGRAWYKRWRDEYCCAYTMVFVTSVFIVANQWPIDERFNTGEVYQPIWDPVFSAVVELFFHIPPRYLLLQGLQATVVHSYVSLGIFGMFAGNLRGALLHVLRNFVVCLLAPVLMSAAWRGKAKQERPQRGPPQNEFQRLLLNAEAALIRLEARLLRLASNLNTTAVVAVVCCPVVVVVVFKNFRAIAGPVGFTPKVCTSSPFEVLAAILCGMALVMTEVGLTAVKLLQQLRSRDALVRDIFPSHIVERLGQRNGSSRSTRDDSDGGAPPSSGHISHNNSHGSSYDGWTTPNSTTPLSGSVSAATSLSASLSGGIASLSSGISYFARCSDTADLMCPLPPLSGSGILVPGDPEGPVTPNAILQRMGLPLSGFKSWSAVDGSPTHAKRRSTGSMATRHPAVTILFADICGFTSMSEVMDPLAVMDMLHSLYTAYDGITNSLPVYKVETIGDCYMAATGLLDEDKRHAEHMLRFAIHMREAAAQLRRPDGTPLRIRVGLHSGEVTSGLIGCVRRRYCLFGDTVNTASRMESTCTPGGIQISAATHALVQHIQDVHWHAKQVEVKGKGLMTVYEWVPEVHPAEQQGAEQQETQQQEHAPF